MRTTLAGGVPNRAPDLTTAQFAVARTQFPPKAPAPAPKPTCNVYFAWDDALNDDFEWEAPIVKVGELARRAAAQPADSPRREPACASDDERAATGSAPAVSPVPSSAPGSARIRERYYAIRFPGAPALAADADVSGLIKVARLFFEDGDSPRAVELLDCAAAVLPGEARLRLAALEILFLARDGEAFVAAARAFRDRFPGSEHWAAIERLGWRFAPRERLFAGGRPKDKADDAHFGAWPESPNWIEAPWDLTCEVLAVELRGRVLGTARPS
ncbi:MAG: hypothetical protein IPL06_17770 [Betaproteobacteria bacterium]|nr:hypothetical protein [Betaproteobacteria bacterium]